MVPPRCVNLPRSWVEVPFSCVKASIMSVILPQSWVEAPFSWVDSPFERVEVSLSWVETPFMTVHLPFWQADLALRSLIFTFWWLIVVFSLARWLFWWFGCNYLRFWNDGVET